MSFNSFILIKICNFIFLHKPRHFIDHERNPYKEIDRFVEGQNPPNFYFLLIVPNPQGYKQLDYNFF